MTTYRDLVDRQNAVPQEVKDIVTKILEGRLDPLLIVESYQAAVTEVIQAMKADNDKLRGIIKSAYKSIERIDTGVVPVLPPPPQPAPKRHGFANPIVEATALHQVPEVVFPTNGVKSLNEKPDVNRQETQGEIEIDLQDGKN